MTNVVEMARTIGIATKISVDRLGGLTKFETTPGGGGITGVVFRSIPALAIAVVVDMMSTDVVGPCASHFWMCGSSRVAESLEILGYFRCYQFRRRSW